MTLRAIISFLVMFATSARGVVSAGSRQEGGRDVNVREFGARGDGVADDTAAIQATINAAKPGETIYYV